MSDWMIYGSTGYTGRLIAQEATARGMRPVLAGRSAGKAAALGERLGLRHRVFGLDDAAAVARQLEGLRLVLNCAGPFSVTAQPLVRACLRAGIHYLDITGEIDVFEYIHALNDPARKAGVVLCPGVGFDVIPTDCLAATLKTALPDATHLALGFDTGPGISPGTAKTMLEGVGSGGRVRRDGRIVPVPLAHTMRRIDFGNGEKASTTIPWGDVSTAWYSTGIPNIEVYVPAPAVTSGIIRVAGRLGRLLRRPIVKDVLTRLIERAVHGPDEQARERSQSYLWGEVRNASSVTRIARLVTANGYSVTVHGALLAVERLLDLRVDGGSYTPSRLFGQEMVLDLPGSSAISIA